jgi:hypothetical protein
MLFSFYQAIAYLNIAKNSIEVIVWLYCQTELTHVHNFLVLIEVYRNRIV